MRRVIRSFRTRKNIHQANALRDQFLRELLRESEALMKQLTEQFNQTLTAQLAQLTQSAQRSIVEGEHTSSPMATGPGSIDDFGQLLSTGVRYLISRPRTNRNSAVSTRSADSLANFRVSQAQTAAEIQALLQRGEKNR